MPAAAVGTEWPTELGGHRENILNPLLQQGIDSRGKPKIVRGFGLAENARFRKNLGEGQFDGQVVHVVSLTDLRTFLL